jgi:pimeloyl-ACP methyl ester carboxylesterase
MSSVKSQDGTSIAYEKHGSGPAVIMIGGALNDPATGRAGRAENEPLAAELAQSFTVYNYDRRGRAESGDTLPYALEREIEDIEALIKEAGGSAHLYGVSSGGALALEAAAAGLSVDKVAVYEVPYSLGEAAQWWQGYVEQLKAALGEGRRGDAVALFMQVAGASEEDVAGAKALPIWADLEGIAHTLEYDAACLGDGPPPTDRLAKIKQPVLVATGGIPDPNMGGLAPGFFDDAADAVVAALPKAEREKVPSGGHVADPKALGPVLEKFFKS